MIPTFRTGFPWTDDETDTVFSRGHLPHMSQCGKVFTLTFRLADSLPPQVAEAYLYQLDHMPDSLVEREDYLRTLRARLMDVLDEGFGSCLFRRHDIRRHVERAIAYHDGRSCDVHTYVVMPNHVHLLLELYPGVNVTAVVGSIKKYSALHINRALGRKGKLWQSEVFDRLIRSYRHYINTVRYIYRNPRHLPSTEFTFYARPDVWEAAMTPDE